MTSITVGTRDFRQALEAVAPHASPDPKYTVLHRIRLDIGAENLAVSATNRASMGHAIVSIWDSKLGSTTAVDLSPLDVKEILLLFKSASGHGEEMPDEQLELTVRDDTLTVTDIGGLFEGKQLVLPRYPTDDNFPKVENLLRNKLASPALGADRLTTDANLLKLFGKAAGAYGEPLVIDPAGNNAAMLITCGESFVGLLCPMRRSDDAEAQIKRWHTDWLERLSTGDTSIPEEFADEPQAVEEDGDQQVLLSRDVEQLCQAAELVISTQFGSVSMLQRKMRVGFARGKQLMAQLEQAAIVGPEVGSAARDVLTRLDQLADTIERIRDEASAGISS